MIDFAHIGRYRENNRIEAKLALGGLPESIWETYSAFANTLGGVILLGVEERADHSLHPVDLPDPEKLVRELWAGLEDRRRVSANVLAPEDVRILTADGCRIIAITVPRAPRQHRPVYIEGDPLRGSYRRSGEGDIRIAPDRAERMRLRALEPSGHRPRPEAGALVAYLTGHIRATADQLSAGLGLSPERTDALLRQLQACGILTEEAPGLWALKGR